MNGILTGLITLACFQPLVCCGDAPGAVLYPDSGHISCACPRIYDPVCGTDGWTYSNECELDCVSDHNVANHLPPINIYRYGWCPIYPCDCSGIPANPICGSDNQTYGNFCYLNCENTRRYGLGLDPISVAYDGACHYPTCECSDVVIPVCGTDNQTYRNICFLQCASHKNEANCLPPIDVQYSGACDTESCICPLNIDPVCGSDEVTYNNLCQLDCENRRRYALGLDLLTVQYNGTCVDCICPAVYDPVCASNGVTFGNGCSLGCENQRRARLGLAPLTIGSHGVCPCICSFLYSPVCGSDGNTYDNTCLLNCENRRLQDLGLPLIEIAYKGVCDCNCGYACPLNYDPVCGSDGRTYSNNCFLSCQMECDPNLYWACDGEC